VFVHRRYSNTTAPNPSLTKEGKRKTLESLRFLPSSAEEGLREVGLGRWWRFHPTLGSFIHFAHSLLGRAIYANVGPMEKVEQVEKEGGVQVYELGYHIVSTVAEENVPKEVESLKAIVLKDGGSLISEGEPKLINLAYSMTKSVADTKKKFNTAYFGWVKFETKSELIPMLKKAVDAHPNVLRYILIKTVRENTMFTPKLTVRTPGKEEAPKPVKKVVKTKETKAASVEELDKTIDELVLE
jgi:ribosomal protein S6